MLPSKHYRTNPPTKTDPMEIDLPMSYKSNKGYSHKPNGISFFASVFSVFFYGSIFYIFGISPSELFNNPKFWFFISNTLILIIVADSGAFSTSKEKSHHQDPYQEYVMHTQLRNNVVPGFITRYPEQKEEVGGDNEDEHENNELEIISLAQDDTRVPSDKCQEVDPHETSKEHEVAQDESIMDKHVVDEETREIVVYKGENENKDIATVEENGDDEFSRMSDEELNRKVEEFILKLKRQIRLQGIRDFSVVN